MRTKVAAEEGGAKAPDVVQRDALCCSKEARQTESAISSTCIQPSLDDDGERLRERPAPDNSKLYLCVKLPEIESMFREWQQCINVVVMHGPLQAISRCAITSMANWCTPADQQLLQTLLVRCASLLPHVEHPLCRALVQAALLKVLHQLFLHWRSHNIL
jgi:hypothetical protein